MTPFSQAVRRQTAARATVANHARFVANPIMIAEPLEERTFLSAVATPKAEPLNTGGVTRTGGIVASAVPAPKTEPLNNGGVTHTGGIGAVTPTGTPTPTPRPTASTSPFPTAVPVSDEDDRLVTATTMKIGVPITDHKIGYDTDVDMFKVSLTAGQIVGFDVDDFSNFSTFDGVIRVFDALGNELATSDDDAGPGETAGIEPYVEFTATLTATYYVAVSGTGNDGYDAVTGTGDAPGDFGPYIISTTLLGETADTDDQIGEAHSIKNTTDTKDGSISNLTDVDMYRFTAKAGDRFLISVTARSTDPLTKLDSALQIFDPSGNVIGADYGGDTLVSFTAPTKGNFYIAVSGNGNVDYDPFLGAYADDSFGSVGTYRLQISKV